MSFNRYILRCKSLVHIKKPKKINCAALILPVNCSSVDPGKIKSRIRTAAALRHLKHTNTTVLLADYRCHYQNGQWQSDKMEKNYYRELRSFPVRRWSELLIDSRLFQELKTLEKEDLHFPQLLKQDLRTETKSDLFEYTAGQMRLFEMGFTEIISFTQELPSVVYGLKKLNYSLEHLQMNVSVQIKENTVSKEK